MGLLLPAPCREVLQGQVGGSNRRCMPMNRLHIDPGSCQHHSHNFVKSPVLLRRHYLDKELPALAAARTILEVPPPQQLWESPTQLCNNLLSIHCSVFNHSNCRVSMHDSMHDYASTGRVRRRQHSVPTAGGVRPRDGDLCLRFQCCSRRPRQVRLRISPPAPMYSGCIMLSLNTARLHAQRLAVMHLMATFRTEQGPPSVSDGPRPRIRGRPDMR